MKVALYARVSKGQYQNPENQVMALKQWAETNKHEIKGIYIDEISSKDTRPQKELVLRMLRLGEIDAVTFWSLDRWGRTLSELVFELEEFTFSKKILISLKEGLDLSNAGGRLFANMLAVFANFERDRIQERTKQGTVRAKAQGKILGRHPVNCGCGITDKNQNKHNGEVKPIRNEHNVFIAWKYPNGLIVPLGRKNKPPMPNIPTAHEEQAKTEQPSV